MEPHARVHARHRQFHAHTPHFKSHLELNQRTSTISERMNSAEVIKRAAPDHSTSSGDGSINPTIPIAVGICVPLVVIIVTFLWLHRRHVKKIRAEERSDPHKSLDFGLGLKANSSRGGKEMSEMDFEKSTRRGRGLSMDLDNPYLLPPELHSSRESLKSLSRSMIHEVHDPYRPATSFFNSAPNSARNSISHDDAASVRTGSTRGQRTEGMSSPLVPNAQRMPFSSSPSPTAFQVPGDFAKSDLRSQSRSPLSSPPLQDNKQDMSQFTPPPPPQAAHIAEERSKNLSPAPISSLPQSPISDGPHQQSPHQPSTLNNRQLDHQQSEQPQISQPQSQHYNEPEYSQHPDQFHHQPTPEHPHQNQIPQISFQNDDYEDDYYDDYDYNQQGFAQHANSASPHSAQSPQYYTPTEEHHVYDHEDFNEGLGFSNVDYNNRRLSVMRPLPPDDPNETPQQRAQRIRSFYKEYFNEQDARMYRQGPNDYYEDYGQEYHGDGTVYDPHAGQFIIGGAPYAEPITRRAMTPPPRGPPRFSGQRGSDNFSPRMQHRARAFSTASAGGMRGRGPKRHAPPPAPLRTLPTPHLLKEDAFSLPIDFAPPTTIKDQAAGRAASPKMMSRPFSPQVAIANPLASAFNELPAMPSPHALRRSGTFTGLDFAPPPRFRDRDGGSDAGSIRSGRSGRSTHSTSSRMHVQNIRAGTYRVSRIPKELVGTQNEFSDILKPTWKVGS